MITNQNLTSTGVTNVAPNYLPQFTEQSLRPYKTATFQLEFNAIDNEPILLHLIENTIGEYAIQFLPSEPAPQGSYTISFPAIPQQVYGVSPRLIFHVTYFKSASVGAYEERVTKWEGNGATFTTAAPPTGACVANITFYYYPDGMGSTLVNTAL